MSFCFSHEEIFYKQQKYDSGYAEYTGNNCAYPAYIYCQADDTAEEVENKQHYKAEQCIYKQLKSPTYRSRKNLYN